MLEYLALNIGLIDRDLAFDRPGRADKQIARDNLAVDCAVNNDLLRRVDRTLEDNAFAEIGAAGLATNTLVDITHRTHSKRR